VPCRYTSETTDAFFAIARDFFAVAKFIGAVHKDPAFQASSPKTFRAGPPGSALFFHTCDQAWFLNGKLMPFNNSNHSFVFMITLRKGRCGRAKQI
jgi:hypothetical protein